jgi:hypothetical protein
MSTRLAERSMPQKKISCESSPVGDVTGATAGSTARQLVGVRVALGRGVAVRVGLDVNEGPFVVFSAGVLVSAGGAVGIVGAGV